MKLLLDTHIVLWALLDPGRLRPEVAGRLMDPQVDVVVSAVVAWEVAIKQSLGKLTLPGPAESWLVPAVEAVGFRWLPISALDAVRVRTLPPVHQDPFDRLLIAQAMGGYTLVTADEVLRGYGVPVIWC